MREVRVKRRSYEEVSVGSIRSEITGGGKGGVEM